MTFLDRAQQIKDGAITIAEWLGSGAETVSKVDAQRRADICLKCPLNLPGVGITSIVANAIRRHLEVKNKLQLRVAGEKSLKTCAACSCQNRLKIWVPIQNLGVDREELVKFDDNCWIRHEFKQG